MRLFLLIIFFSSTSFFTSKHRVALLLSKDIKPELVDSIKFYINKFYHQKTDLISVDCVPNRTIYDVDSLLDDVEDITLPKEYVSKVYLTGGEIMRIDEYSIHPLYGYTNEDTRTSVISYDMMDSCDFVWQTVNVVIHEMGHQFGLFHCDDTACIMTPAGYLDDRTFCKGHRKYLDYLIKKNKLYE